MFWSELRTTNAPSFKSSSSYAPSVGSTVSRLEKQPTDHLNSFTARIYPASLIPIHVKVGSIMTSAIAPSTWSSCIRRGIWIGAVHNQYPCRDMIDGRLVDQLAKTTTLRIPGCSNEARFARVHVVKTCKSWKTGMIIRVPRSLAPSVSSSYISGELQ